MKKSLLDGIYSPLIISPATASVFCSSLVARMQGIEYANPGC
jgi:hypothetical protein